MMTGGNFRLRALALTGAICTAAVLSVGGLAYGADAAGSTARVTAADHAPAAQTPSNSGTLPDISPATTPAPVVTSIDVKPGDRWVLSITDDITGDLVRTLTMTVTENQGGTVTAQNSYVEANAAAGSLPRVNTYTFDQSWNTISDGVWSWKPSAPAGIKLPLKLGAQWTTKTTVSRQGPNLSYTLTGTAKVTSWDHITLPSGLEYDAYRIEITTRARQNPQRLVESKSTFWYAPDVDHVIWRIEENRLNGHLTDRLVQSLTEYKRRDG